MPVQRFTTSDAARRALLLETADPRLPGRLRRLWHTASRLAPGVTPRGIRKFAGIEEANAARGTLTTERIRRLRTARGLG